MINSPAATIRKPQYDTSYVSRALRMIVGLPLLLLFSVAVFFAQATPTGNSPLRVESIRGNLRMSNVVFTIQCIAEQKFTDGSIICTSSKYGNKKIDTLSLWTGSSDSTNFDRTYHYILQLPNGKRGHVTAVFRGQTEGNSVSSSLELYACRVVDTLLVDNGSYAALDRPEVDYLIRKKGYEQKSEDEIKALDPDLWKKMQKLKAQGGMKK